MKVLLILLVLIPLKTQVISSKPVKKDIIVTATCYNATVEQCDSDPSTTAFGYKVNMKYPLSQKYIAISRDLEEYFKAGDTVIVEGTFVYDGYWIVADRMNKRWEKKIDFLVKKNDFMDRFDNVTIIHKDERRNS
jgi:3D (Asp-Asp-Asp) domain-containing protein